MVVTDMRCTNCGYEWRSRTGKSKRCPSCLCKLGETKFLRRQQAELKLAKLLASRGWNIGPIGGRKMIDVCAERAGKRLYIDVKSGRSYHIRPSQLKGLLEHRNKTSDVGFACEMDGKFYVLILRDIL